MLAGLLFMFASCSDGGSDSPETPKPQPQPEANASITFDSDITSSGLVFDEQGGEKSVSFTTNKDWTLSIAATTRGTSWCTASEESGSKGDVTIKFTVTENTEIEDRSVAVTIKAGTASQTFKIAQKGVDALLVTTSTFEVPQEGGTIDVEVKANIDYQLEIAETAKGWITEATSRALTTKKHSFAIAVNEESEKREGEIYIKSGDKLETVKVYQAGGALILLSQNEYTVSDAGETITVDVKSNVEYGVQMPDVDWIVDEASTRGMSSHTLQYTILPNETYDSRSAEIIFYDKVSELKDTLTITQVQKDAIILSQKEISVENEGGTIEVKLSANVDFEVTMPDVDWISQVESRGLVEHTLYFEVAENTSEKNRSAGIVFTDKENEVSETLYIKQLNDYGYFEYRDQHNRVVYVELYKAGTLEKTLEYHYYYSLFKWCDLTKLILAGPLNGDDIYYIRKNLKVQTYHSEAYSATEIALDLSEATIVEGGRCYNEECDEKKEECKDRSHYTTNNVIGDRMFCGLENLTSITLPKNAISIEAGALASCPHLSYVFMGDEITSIGETAFYNCGKLWRISIGKGVVSIGESCFRNSGVSSIVIPDNVTSIGEKAFYECYSLKSVTIGNGVTVIDNETFKHCESLTSIVIPDNVTIIDEQAFYNCKSLTSVTIGNGVTIISWRAFCGCEALTSVVIPDSVVDFYSYSFSGCKSLASVTIGKGVTSINKEVFYGCENLSSIIIPDNIVSIGDRAFYGCKSLASVTIGKGVTSIGEDAFYDCKALNSVYITDLTSWCNIEFKNPLNYGTKLYLEGKELTELIIPEGITTIKANTFRGCSSISYATIGNAVTSIKHSAFEDCTSLTSVVIGDGVKEINSCVFKGCPINKVSLGKNVEKIGEEAFRNTSIKECYSYNPNPPIIKKGVTGSDIESEFNTFYQAFEENAVLYVPAGSSSKYENSWSRYRYRFTIVEME